MAYARINKINEKLDELERAYNVNVEPDIYIDGLNMRVNHINAVKYDPAANSEAGTFVNFHNSKAQVRLMTGPFGSGKSTTCCHEVVRQSCLIAPMKDGVRRSKWAIIRNTMGELESTTLSTWLSWFGNLGTCKRTKKPLLSYTYNFKDDKGDVEMQIIFIGLDREDDKQKLESLELTGAYLNEMQHIPHGIFVHVFGRLGRYPKKKEVIGEKVPKLLIADTNPPDEDHWIFNNFEVDAPDNTVVFHQPPGLIKNVEGKWTNAQNYDNITNLDSNYYYDMAKTNHFREEYIKVYCRGEYGIVIPGKPVYPEYNDDLHSCDDIEVLRDQPIILGWDFGTTPCCLLTQFTESGQKRHFKEFCTEFSSVRTLARDIVKPYLDTELEGMEIHSVGDPSGVAKSQNDGVSVLEVLDEVLGFETLAAKTNDIAPRKEAARAFLTKMVGVPAQPGVLISRIGCPTLRKSMLGKYCYKRIRVIGDEKYKDIPDKSHPWSDIADADQYTSLEFMGDGLRISGASDLNLDEFTEANLTSGWV